MNCHNSKNYTDGNNYNSNNNYNDNNNNVNNENNNNNSNDSNNNVKNSRILDTSDKNKNKVNIYNNNNSNNSSSNSLYKIDKIPPTASYENQSTRSQLSVYAPQVQNNKNKNFDFRETQSGIHPPRDHSTPGKFSDDEILEAFVAFDLDKNNFIGAAEIRHVLINIGEQVRTFLISSYTLYFSINYICRDGM